MHGAVAVIAGIDFGRFDQSIALGLLTGAKLRDPVSHVGAIRTQRLWLFRVSAWLLPLLAAVNAASIRVHARGTFDPLTGLATPLVFHQRVHAVRNLIRRHGRPSVLLLGDIENLAVPVSDVPAQRLLQQMAARLDAELEKASERRIVTITADDLS